ncbi:MAG: ExbD/TolR family protein [Akkermansiaceae bacterium]
MKNRRSSDIPVDSFSDIAFLLIIYFMVATTLVKVKSVTADLPAGEKSTQAKSEKTPIINLRGGEIFFSDKPVKMDELNERLAALDLPNQDGEKRVIMLEAAKGTPYENYFKVLAAISANGGVVAIVEDE